MTDLYDEDDSDYMTCRFCGRTWGDHEHACPYGDTDQFEDLGFLAREEDRYVEQFGWRRNET